MSEIDKRVNRIVPRKPNETEHAWSLRCRDYVLDYVRNKPQKPPNKDWAHRIVERHNRGESVPHQSLKMAQDVTGHVAMREPGEEG